MPTKVLITGGHLTPALAVIDELKKSGAEILFVGRHFTDQDNSPSKEKQEVVKKGVTFSTIDAAKIHSKPKYKNIYELTKIPKSFIQAARIINSSRPNIVLCFGGYLSLPIALTAKVFNIPLITHEQTTVLGKANQVLAQVSDKLALSWKATQSVPKRISGKTVITGNPVRKEFLSPGKKPDWYQNPHNLPLIYITGGNQGSLPINMVIKSLLEKLTTNYSLIHQTGDARGKADHKVLSQSKDKLEQKNQANYYPQTWIDANEVSWIMHNARLVIGRSGANTVAELIVCSAQAILIPLPFSSRSEQARNALLLENLGLATHLPQDNINDLEDKIKKSLSSPQKTNQQLLLQHKKTFALAASSLASLTLSCARKN